MLSAVLIFLRRLFYAASGPMVRLPFRRSPPPDVHPLFSLSLFFPPPSLSPPPYQPPFDFYSSLSFSLSLSLSFSFQVQIIFVAVYLSISVDLGNTSSTALTFCFSHCHKKLAQPRSFVFLYYSQAPS